MQRQHTRVVRAMAAPTLALRRADDSPSTTTAYDAALRRFVVIAPLLDVADATSHSDSSSDCSSSSKRADAAAAAPPRNDDADDADAMAKKRFRYKIYQRRHRARQREKAKLLEAQVAQLSREIASLAVTLKAAAAARHIDRNDAPAAGAHAQATASKVNAASDIDMVRSAFVRPSRPTAPATPSATLPVSSTTSSVRYTLAGAPAQLVREYLRCFEHGYVFKHRRAQEAFVRAMVTSDVRGPRVDGADQLLEQWRRYDQVFAMVHVATNAMTVERIDAQQTAVVVGVTLRLRLRRGGALSLFPSLDAGEEGEARRRAVLDRLVGDLLVVDGSLRFVVERCDRVSWLGARMDFVAALARATGSFATACACLDGALLDASTGFLRCEHDAVGLSDRHELSFILC